MKKPWTLRLLHLGSARPAAYSAGFDPRFWTRRGAARKAAALNADLAHHRNYLWVPALAKRAPW